MAEKRRSPEDNNEALTERLESLSVLIDGLDKSIRGLSDLYKENLEKIDALEDRMGLVEDRLTVIQNIPMLQSHIRSAQSNVGNR